MGVPSIKQLLLLLSVSLMAPLCLASQSETNILLALSSEDKSYLIAAETFEQQFSGNIKHANIQRAILPRSETATTSHAQQPNLIVTIGSKACLAYAQVLHDTPLLCGFVTEQSYRAIIGSHPDRKNMTGLYIDQPIERLLHLGTLLTPSRNAYTFGVLSNQSMPKEETRALNQAQVSLQKITLSASDNPLEKLAPAIRDSDLFIVQPSASLFNRLTAKLILQLSLRNKTPIIGFSQQYTDAGALISLFTSPSNIGRDIADTSEAILRAPQKSLPPPCYSRQYSLAVNKNIARKFNLTINAPEIHRQLINFDGGVHD